MKMVVIYLGSEIDETAMELFNDLYNSSAKVLFEMWKPSIFTAADWDFVSFPVQHDLAKQSQIFRGVSSAMKYISNFANNLLSSGFIMGTADYDWMFQQIYLNYDGEGSVGMYDWDHLDICCRWLNESEASWQNWIDVRQKQDTNSICADVTDETLLLLLAYRELSDVQIEATVMAQGRDFFEPLDATMIDLFSVHYALAHCIELDPGVADTRGDDVNVSTNPQLRNQTENETENETESKDEEASGTGGYTMAVIVSGVTGVVVGVCAAAGIIYCRKKSDFYSVDDSSESSSFL